MVAHLDQCIEIMNLSIETGHRPHALFPARAPPNRALEALFYGRQFSKSVVSKAQARKHLVGCVRTEPNSFSSGELADMLVRIK